MGLWNEVDGETPIDPSLLVDDLRGIVTNRSELIPVEAENIRKATAKYLAAAIPRSKAVFDLSWMCQVHCEMFDDVWQWAGVIRRSNLNIGIHFSQVEVQLVELSHDLKHWEADGTLPFLEQAARLHHRCAEIHPFPNGNGRWSRLLANIWLHAHQQNLIVWPASEIEGNSGVRSEYLKSLKLADDGEFESLIALHSRFQSTE